MELTDREKALLLDALEFSSQSFHNARNYDAKAEADILYRRIAESITINKES